MPKKLILLLCVVCLLTFVACKQDITPENLTSSTATQSETLGANSGESTDQTTSSGIALEDDVFDESKKPITSAQNSQASVGSSQKEEPKDTTNTKNESTDEETTKNDDGTTDGDITQEAPSESESSQPTSSDEATVEDGVVKLPIDRFN